MEKLLEFVVEHTVANGAPIFLAAGAVALLLGPFLINVEEAQVCTNFRLCTGWSGRRVGRLRQI